MSDGFFSDGDHGEIHCERRVSRSYHGTYLSPSQRTRPAEGRQIEEFHNDARRVQLYCKVPVLSTDCGNIAEVLPNESIAETNDKSFQHLLEKWVGKINELSLLQKNCFNQIKCKNLLSIQTQKVNRKYQEFLSIASK